MRFTVSRLCGGKALMVSSTADLGIDMDTANGVLSGYGEIKDSDDMMTVMLWNGMEVTFYPQGRIMFHPLGDADTAIRYANEIIGKMLP